MKIPFIRKRKPENSVAVYFTGYLYQNHIAPDYYTPECWSKFKERYRKSFTELIRSTGIDADNVDFHNEHIQIEYKRALSALEVQRRQNISIIKQTTNRRDTDLKKAKKDLEELQLHLSDLDSAYNELTAIRREHNENSYSFYF